MPGKGKEKPETKKGNEKKIASPKPGSPKAKADHIEMAESKLSAKDLKLLQHSQKLEEEINMAANKLSYLKESAEKSKAHLTDKAVYNLNSGYPN